MTSDMTDEQKLAKYWCDKHLCDPFDFSDYAALGRLLADVKKEQREICAAKVKAEGYRKNHVPTVHDYVQACLNATGEKDGCI